MKLKDKPRNSSCSPKNNRPVNSPLQIEADLKEIKDLCLKILSLNVLIASEIDMDETECIAALEQIRRRLA